MSLIGRILHPRVAGWLHFQIASGLSVPVPTMVEPIATPAAVEAICPNSPGCFGCCAAGCATLEAGLAAGTLETGLGGARDEDRLSLRGMRSLDKNSVGNIIQRRRDVNALWLRRIDYDVYNQLIGKLKGGRGRG